MNNDDHASILPPPTCPSIKWLCMYMCMCMWTCCVCVVCLFWWLIRAARQGICSEVNEGCYCLRPFLFPSKKHFLVAMVVRASRCTWPSASGSSPGYADSLEALLLLWLPSFRSVASDCGSEAAAAANGFCEAYEQCETVRRPKHIKEHFWVFTAYAENQPVAGRRPLFEKKLHRMTVFAG